MACSNPSEDRAIARWIRNWPSGAPLATGPGDDCALLHPADKNEFLVLKTDALVEGVHFHRNTAPQLIGRKAINRVLSDFAAMGATPQTVLITVGLPRSLSPGFVQKCYRGMAQAARKHHVSLAGGETTRSAELWFNVAGAGRVLRKQAVLRSGGKPGDIIYVTGLLGGSGQKKHLSFIPRLKEGNWLALHHFASAMMDLSDGLGKDLPRLARASGTSFTIFASALPITPGCTAQQAVNDGEDYELLFSVHSSKADALEKKWPFRTRLTRIGVLERKNKKPDTAGLKLAGFDHFAP